MTSMETAGPGPNARRRGSLTRKNDMAVRSVVRPLTTPVLAVALAGLLAASCSARRTAGVAAPVEGADWVRTTLSAMTLEQKAGQVLMPVFRGYHVHPDSPYFQKLEGLVGDLGVGGLILSRGDPLETISILNRLQAQARIPLLVAADLEWGAGIQVAHGATLLPYAMAVGATGSEAMAEAHGRATAREGRALGVHMTFAPVLDVNSNPENPIINIRSYGEDPALVARLGAAFTRGARQGGLLTTAKHFPGHGDTSVDSHRALATVSGDRARLDTVELPPFRAAVTAGVDAIMVGHLAVPAVDASLVPATISRPVVTGLLRGEMGFRGLIVSDALDMRGITDAHPPGEAAVRTLLAGQDLLLMSPDPIEARRAVVDAVRTGRLPAARLDDAVRRVLQAKVKAGLHLPGGRAASFDRLWRDLGDPVALEDVQAVADRSITLLRNEGGVLPLRRGGRVLHVSLSGDVGAEPLHDVADTELRRFAPEAETAPVDPRTPPAELEALIGRARSAEAILVSAFVRVRAYKGTAALPAELGGFMARLVALGRPLVVVSFGSPYLVTQFPTVPAYLCAYGHSPLSQRAAMRAVYGEIETTGRLPVTIPGLFARGEGMAPGAR